jgi:hypothetical protein
VRKILVTKTASNVENVTGKADDVIDSMGDRVDLYWNGQWIGYWDGTNAGEQTVENGVYFIQVDSVDPYGVVKSVTLNVTVARPLARLTILVYNAAGEVVRHLTELEADSLPSAEQVVLSSDVIQPGAGFDAAQSTLTVSVSGGPSVVWDGRNDDGTTVGDGTYFVEVRTDGEQGSETIVVKAVSVLGATTAGVARAWPNVLTRGNRLCEVVASPGETVQAVVYTSAGEKAGVLWGETGSGRARWDSEGLASGLYFLVVSVRDSAGRYKGRSVLKIIVQ